MSRLYLRFYLALVASLGIFVVAAVCFMRLQAGPMALPGEHIIYARQNFHIVMGVLAFGIGLVALPLVRQITKRRQRLQRGVESLGAGDLSARVPVEGNDEVAQLASSFNRSAARIEQLVKAN